MLFLCFVVWVAFFLGVIVGWAWKPRWATLGSVDKFNFSSPSSVVVSSPIKGLASNSLKVWNPSYGSCAIEEGAEKEQVSVPVAKDINCR